MTARGSAGDDREWNSQNQRQQHRSGADHQRPQHHSHQRTTHGGRASRSLSISRTLAVATTAALGLGMLTISGAQATAGSGDATIERSPAAGAPRATQTVAPKAATGDEPRAAGLIVQWDAATTLRPSQINPGAAAQRLGVRPKAKPGPAKGLMIWEFDAPTNASAAQRAAQQAAALPGVRAVEPDWIIRVNDLDPATSTTSTTATTATITSDTVTPQVIQTGAPWGLDRIDQRAGLNGTYDYMTSGRNVRAYIVDTGVYGEHQDFAGRMLPGFSAVNDGRGTDDCNGHGTHVAGTTAGTTYGVAKDAWIVPVRAMDCLGEGTYSQFIAGLSWIQQTHPVGTPAVVNMSLGGPASSFLDSSVQALINSGMTVVAASGNDGANACNYSPARIPDAITVNASDSNDSDGSFSNLGPCTDLYAPGVSIVSAGTRFPGDTLTISGTSMAAPHVAGVAARVLGANPSWSPAQVWAHIDSQTTFVNFGYAQYGDPNKLLFIDPADGLRAPDAPTDVSAVGIAQSATVSWVAPANDGGAPITSYTARATDSDASCTTQTELACTITGLTPERSYRFVVTATNDFGASALSSPSNEIQIDNPIAIPGAVVNVKVKTTKRGLRVTWNPPRDTGGAAIGRYQTKIAKTKWKPQPRARLDITGLKSGRAYVIRIRATNEAGPGPATKIRVRFP